MKEIFLWRVDSVILNHTLKVGSDSGGFRYNNAAKGVLLWVSDHDGNERGMDVN